MKITARNLKGFHTELSKGLERILTPILWIFYDGSCTEIYQPIIPKEFPEWKNSDIYKTPYAKKSLDPSHPPIIEDETPFVPS